MLNSYSTGFSKDADETKKDETASSSLGEDKNEKEEEIPSIPYYRLVSGFSFRILDIKYFPRINFQLFAS